MNKNSIKTISKIVVNTQKGFTKTKIICMYVKKFTILLLLAISTSCFSQDTVQNDITDVTKATFLRPGISYEKRIGKFQSLFAQAFVAPSFYYSYSISLGERSEFSFDPGLNFQYRYYYNYDKRQEKGKRTEMNSLNYVSPTFETVFSKAPISEDHYFENDRRPVNTVGFVWGIQRNYKKRFSLDLNLGLGYLFTTATMSGNNNQTAKKHVSEFTGLGQFNLGFWLNKRK